MGKSEVASCRIVPDRNASPRRSGEVPGNRPGNWLDTGDGKHARAGKAPGEQHGKFPRFTPRLEMYVFHQGVGRVLDISMGGVSFSYIAESHPPEELPREGMLFTHSGQHIQEIPFEVVADEVCSQFFLSDYFVMERRVRFGELSEVQIRQLESFILHNAHIPQYSYDTRYTEYKSVYASAGLSSGDRKARAREGNADVRLV
ncbi:MAG: PilZ domain-containing protein [Desulfurivibrionaceae bacterium]